MPDAVRMDSSAPDTHRHRHYPSCCFSSCPQRKWPVHPTATRTLAAVMDRATGPQCPLEAGAFDRAAPLRDSHRLCHLSRSGGGGRGDRIEHRLGGRRDWLLLWLLLHDLLRAIQAGIANGDSARSCQQWLDLVFRLVTKRTTESRRGRFSVPPAVQLL